MALASGTPLRVDESPGHVGRRDPSADDARLVAAILAGERDAFSRLVEREADGVFRTCYRILGRFPDAEDTVQETFMIAHRALAGYRGEGSLGAWLARIAARESFRRLGARKRLGILTPLADEAEAEPGASDPLEDALTAERQRGVRRAVASLTEPYREVVVLRFFGELSLAEIAASTGRPIGTVKAQLHRGLARLRMSLEQEGAR